MYYFTAIKTVAIKVTYFALFDFYEVYDLEIIDIFLSSKAVNYLSIMQKMQDLRETFIFICLLTFLILSRMSLQELHSATRIVNTKRLIKISIRQID